MLACFEFEAPRRRGGGVLHDRPGSGEQPKSETTTVTDDAGSRAQDLDFCLGCSGARVSGDRVDRQLVLGRNAGRPAEPVEATPQVHRWLPTHTNMGVVAHAGMPWARATAAAELEVGYPRTSSSCRRQ